MALSLLLAVILIAYLLGSFPTGFIAGKLVGVDIRMVGSGNVGATNVTRVLGKGVGYPVFLIDFGKGFGAVWVAVAIAKANQASAQFLDFSGAIAAVAAVVGHSYPLWLRFQGGKGVATCLGALFAMNWIAAVSVCVVWILLFQATRYVSVASLGAAIALPLAMTALLLLRQVESGVLPAFALLLALIVIWRHRSNISRLMHGTEPRFNRK